ncbi:MAG: riboflavin synthase [Chitinophagaceae bacterium]|nr:riboflavin synthase [Chitinophagaceae bacterium]
MFTGIIESAGIIKEVISNGSNRSFWIESSISDEFRVDQSVSHSGVCLTVEEVDRRQHRVTAIEETLSKTNISNWKVGTQVNLERCLVVNARLDGHFVQGHIDTTGTCKERLDKKGSWEFEFQFPGEFASLIIEKGSIAINGVSLTAFNVKKKRFSVAIIPYTFDHTDLQHVQPGDAVNLEFDIIGKYILRRVTTGKYE